MVNNNKNKLVNLFVDITYQYQNKHSTLLNYLLQLTNTPLLTLYQHLNCCPLIIKTLNNKKKTLQFIAARNLVYKTNQF